VIRIGLARNAIGAGGAAALAAALRTNACLEALDLRDNLLTHDADGAVRCGPTRR
jgi:Ran GTPase-activating protein (RanGAP) involved in mRNA processing and transport